MHTFFTELSGNPGEAVALNPRERDHLFKTLRARPGDEVELFDGRGCRMTGIVREERCIELLETERCPEPEKKLHLFCAVPRKAKFDVLLKQAAELGVWSVRLIECARSVAKPEGSDRWQLLLQEGCKQSKNPFLPRIVPPVPLAAALEEVPAQRDERFLRRRPFRGAGGRGGRRLRLVRRPRRRFTEEEESAMREAGVRGLNLGPYVLRLETAAVCGLAVLRQWMR